MKKINNIIEKINGLLRVVFSFIYKKSLKIIPAPIVQLYLKIIAFLTEKKKRFITKVSVFFKKINQFIKNVSNNNSPKRIKTKYKNKYNQQKQKTIQWRKKVFSKSTLALITGFIIAKKSSIHSWFISLSPKAFLTTASLGAIISISSLNIYYSSKRIYKESVVRKPAAVEPIITNTRPKYYNIKEKQVVLENITLPIYTSSETKDLEHLSFDFNIQFSNRYLVHVFKAKENEFKSHVITQVQPFHAEFLLTLEGKEIIKNKIKQEVDKYLQKNKFEGSVEKVYIEQIIAG